MTSGYHGSSIIKLLRSLLPILLSHHPDCSIFHMDTIPIFRTRICLGCSLTYPIAIALLVSYFLIGWEVPTFFIHSELLMVASLVLGSVQFLKYTIPVRGTAFRVIVKIALGLSLGGLVVWILSFPGPWWVKLGLFFLAAIIISMIGTYRYNYLRRTCSTCMYHGDWELCFGFRTLNKHTLLKQRMSKVHLRALMFDEATKRRTGERSIDPVKAQTFPEPPLDDPPPWLYFDDSYRIPWLPLTGLEVRSRSELRSILAPKDGVHISNFQK